MLIGRVDNFLNSITMYRLILYALSAMTIFSVLVAYAGYLPFSGSELLLSVLALLVACLASNRIVALVLKAPTNVESDSITALILFFVMTPAVRLAALPQLAAVGVIAMATKYLFAWRKKHILNPAAAGAVLAGFTGLGASSWWISLGPLLPISLVLGLLIVRKLRRFCMFFVFVAVSLVSVTAYSFFSGTLSANWFIDIPLQVFTVWPLFFFGTIMLTEPQTTPPTANTRMVYGALVGVLFGAPLHVGSLYLTSELSLVLGNLYSFFVSSKQRLFLTLVEKKKLAPAIYELVFSPDRTPAFLPGQFLEWTLSHAHPDERGNRRYFTIASSPTERYLRIGVKIIDASSSYKKALLAFWEKGSLVAGQLGGDFVLPRDTGEKLVFIAGGIGVTPFRSMVKYMIDRKQMRDIVLFYTCVDVSEFVYRDLLEEGEEYGLKTVYVLTKKEAPPVDFKGRVGFINKEMILSEVADIAERTYYLSGPPAMVKAYHGLLRSLHIGRRRIKTDYFPGY